MCLSPRWRWASKMLSAKPLLIVLTNSCCAWQAWLQAVCSTHAYPSRNSCSSLVPTSIVQIFLLTISSFDEFFVLALPALIPQLCSVHWRLSTPGTRVDIMVPEVSSSRLKAYLGKAQQHQNVSFWLSACIDPEDGGCRLPGHELCPRTRFPPSLAELWTWAPGGALWPCCTKRSPLRVVLDSRDSTPWTAI